MQFGNHTDVKDLTNSKSVMVMMIITTARAGIGCAQKFINQLLSGGGESGWKKLAFGCLDQALRFWE